MQENSHDIDINKVVLTIPRNSIALTSNIFTELANTMKYGGRVLYNFLFTELQFKTVFGDVFAFHRIMAVHMIKYLHYNTLVRDPGIAWCRPCC